MNNNLVNDTADIGTSLRLEAAFWLVRKGHAKIHRMELAERVEHEYGSRQQCS